MRVSKVNIMPVKPDKGLLAFASIVIDDNIYLSSIAIYAKLDGSYRLLYPTKTVGNRPLGLFYPINREASKTIEKAVFKRCEEIFEGCSDDRHHQDSRAI
ncbi:MAG: septation protein SpoVG family protein [Candidatus Saccharimonadales bacterium]